MPAEEEWPDAKEIKAARRAEEEAKTPIPERCWALRNVAGAAAEWDAMGQFGVAAGHPQRCWPCIGCMHLLANNAACIVSCCLPGTLSMGGPGERARARQLLEQAVQLKQQFAGAPDHPGVLPAWGAG